MADFKVTTEELNKSSGIIMEKMGTYNVKWQNIYTEVQALVGVNWAGETSEMFNQRLEGYRNDFEAMSKVLTEYASFLSTTAANIAQTEEALKNAASQLHVGV